MSTQDYVKLYTGNFIIAQRIIAELDTRGIIPVVKDESESARLAGYGQFSQGIQDIYVTQEELSLAKEITDGILTEMQS